MLNKAKNVLLILFSVGVFLCGGLWLVGCGKSPTDGGASLVDEPIVADEIFHDIGDVYVSHIEPKDTDTVTMRLRVRRKNATEVTLRYTTDLDKASAEECSWKDIPMQFDYADANGYYDYYKCEVPPQKTSYRYHFVVKNNVGSICYNMRQCEESETGLPANLSQNFLAQINFSTPDWSKGALWYSAMPDSFFNGETFSDKYGGGINQDVWGLTHSGGLDYFGGDLKGLYEKIDFFKELNVDGLYINPIWLANHNAGYGAFDLTNLDSTFGSEEMLQILTDELHANDMKFMMDGVFAFLVTNSIYVNGGNSWFTENAENQSSPYYSVFVRDQNGKIQSNQFGPIIDLGKQSSQRLIYSAPDSVMQYYLTEFGLDGWRLDSSVLFGGTNTNGTKIIQDMRKYMKEVAPDSLLCIENASASTMYTDYAADTYWSQEFLAGVRNFAATQVSAESLAKLEENCFGTVAMLPRATGLSLYTISADHDTMRLLDGNAANGNVSKAMSVHLLLMTYMGAPSLFYGEEIGMSSKYDHSFFESMNWDRSTWNYDIFNFYKALGQFRAEHKDLFKYGIIRRLGVDEENLLLKYQRSYQGTSILTVLNPNGGVRKGVEIDVHTLEVKNGEKVYDYLSGNSYTVQDGKITIDVMPYGALLTNKGANSWAGKWQVFGEGGAVRQTNANELTVEGNGTFATLPIYNNAKLSFVAEGNVLAALRAGTESNVAYYGAEISGTQLVVKARESAGGAERTVATLALKAGQRVELVRSNGNTFYVTIDGAKQANSECYAELSYEGVAAIGGLNGEGKAKDVALTMNAEDNQRATQFDKATDSMTFYAGDTSKASIASGKLKLAASDEGVFALTHAQMRDFTVKAQMSGTPKQAGDLMGVAVYQTKNSYLFAGRAYVDGGVKIVFGLVENGVPMLNGFLPDASGDLVFQIERTGAHWAARYKTANGSFQTIGNHLIANFSDMNAGVCNVGKGEAIFEYYCLGDAIGDGHSLSAHAGQGALSIDNIDFGQYGVVGYTVSGGNWKITNGGLLQSDANAESATLRAGQSFVFFRSDYTVKFMQSSANSYAAFSFGGDADGGSVRLYPNGKLALYTGGRSVKEYTIPDYRKEEDTRIFVQYSDRKVLTVSVGALAKTVITVSDFTASGGAPRWQTHKASIRLCNYQCQSYSDDYPVYGGVSVSGGEIYNPNANMYVVSNGITDCLVSFRVAQFQRGKPGADAYFAFVFGGSVGFGENCEGAMKVGMTLSKELFVEIGGEKVASYKLANGFDIGNMYLTVAVQNKTVRVFAGASARPDLSGKPVLSYTDTLARGGAFMFESVNARTRIGDVFVYGLGAEEKIESVSM